MTKVTKRKHLKVQQASENNTVVSKVGCTNEPSGSGLCRASSDKQALSSKPQSHEVARLKHSQLHPRSYKICRGSHRMGRHQRQKGVTVLGNVGKSCSKLRTNAQGRRGAPILGRKCMIVDLTGDDERKKNYKSEIPDMSLSVESVTGKVGKKKRREKSSDKHIDKFQPRKHGKKSSSDSAVQMKCQSEKLGRKSSSGGVVPHEFNNTSLSSVSDDFIVLDISSDESDAVLLSPITSANEEESNAITVCPSVLSAEHVQMHIFRQYDTHTMLMMKPQCQVSVKGKVSVECLSGKVLVLGYQIVPNCKKYSVYCPNSSSFLSLQAIDDGRHARNHCKLEPELRAKLADYPVVVELQPLQCPVTSSISHEVKFRTLFPDFSISSVPDSSANTVIVPEIVMSTADVWLADARNGLNATIAVCGGLNTGKSTAARYLINHALNSVPQVAFLECDIGQTEFTAPGCVSLTLVNEPVFGPPFTHQRTTVSSVFVGRVSPASCSKFYVQCLKHVFSAYSHLPSKPPLIINTMGWMKDVGLSLLVDTLRLTAPGVVIQMCNDRLHQIRHLPMMTPEFLASSSGVVFKQANSIAVQYKWIRVASEVNSRSKGDNTYNARSRRDISVLAYFGQMITDPGDVLKSLRAFTPFKVQWTNVAIHVCHDIVTNSQILYAVNGNMVALCVASPSQILNSDVPNSPKFLKKDSICECLGFGIVRSISSAEQALFIITPLAPSELQKVNCLQLGAVGLPTCLLTSDEPAACSLPYVDHIQKVPVIPSRRTGDISREKYSVRDDFV